MVIKGKSVAGAKRVADHLKRTDSNERMEVKELKGVASETLAEALKEMEAVASANPNCKRPFYHASINTRPEEHLTDEQRMRAIDRLEAELGLQGQSRIVVVHEKEGREHCHVVWSRVNSDTLKTISDSHNYRKHELVARELEREFGHERVQGAHIERDGKPRPERTASHKEHQQAQRTGISATKARDEITALWKMTDSGQAFQQALNEKGWILARGDRRDFVAVDRFGGVHSLARRIKGATAADVRHRLADIDPRTLASAADAREVQLARLSEHERDAQRKRELFAQGRLEAANAPNGQKIRQASRGRAASASTRAASRAAMGVAKTVGSAFDVAAGLAEGLLGGGPAKPAYRTRDVQEKTREERTALDPGPPPPRHDLEQRLRQSEEDKSKLRQQYLRDFDREVPEERQRDADLTRERGHEGGRERKRGE